MTPVSNSAKSKEEKYIVEECNETIAKVLFCVETALNIAEKDEKDTIFMPLWGRDTSSGVDIIFCDICKNYACIPNAKIVKNVVEHFTIFQAHPSSFRLKHADELRKWYERRQKFAS